MPEMPEMENTQQLFFLASHTCLYYFPSPDPEFGGMEHIEQLSHPPPPAHTTIIQFGCVRAFIRSLRARGGRGCIYSKEL